MPTSLESTDPNKQIVSDEVVILSLWERVGLGRGMNQESTKLEIPN